MKGEWMTVNVRYLEGVRFEAEARGHRVVSDLPPANGGTDGGMMPPEFLLVSLGTCAGYYAAQYLRTRQLSARDLTIRVEAEKAAGPARLAGFIIEVAVSGLDESGREGLLRAVKSCLIHNTLTHSAAQIDIRLNMPAAV
jgi:uncharacterized OsmC-like protein